MKITAVLLLLLVLFLPTALAQEDIQLNLPEGAVARLGKGKVSQVQYSPDGTWLVVASSIGIWLYDTKTYRAVALLGGHRRTPYSVVFSPAGTTLAGAWGKTVLLWAVEMGEQTQEFTGHSVVFSPDGTMLLWKMH